MQTNATLKTSYISIHALREEGDMQTNATLKTSYISIHALREEGDCAVCNFGRGIFKFLSTPSARRATLFLGLHR